MKLGATCICTYLGLSLYAHPRLFTSILAIVMLGAIASFIVGPLLARSHPPAGPHADPDSYVDLVNMTRFECVVSAPSHSMLHNAHNSL